MKAIAVVVLLLFGSLAGCSGTHSPTDSNTTTGSNFDGAAALAFVKGLALQADNSPRYRIPSTQGQTEGAQYLWGATQLPGWARSWQNFTGEDYLALDRSPVREFTPGPGVDRAYCSETAEKLVPSLRFSNLVAVRPGTKSGGTFLLIGAHWDSQMHSDNDVPANRSKPDPGANDGASGVGVLLQLMRELDKAPSEVTVGVFFIDGEDGFYDCYPDAGSLYYAQKTADLPDAFILLDMVGDPGALYPRESYSHGSAPALQDLLWRHGQATPEGAKHFVNSTAPIQDDHLAFIHSKVPSVDLIDAGRPTTFPPQWDTTRDTVDKLDASMLALVGNTLLATLHDPGLPAALR